MSLHKGQGGKGGDFMRGDFVENGKGSAVTAAQVSDNLNVHALPQVLSDLS